MRLGNKERNSLKSDAVHGVKWSAISQGGRQVSQWITIIILARILTPADFGLVGMAMVVIGFMNIFRDMGTSPAIIQRQVLSENLLSSIFWVNLIIGILSMSVVFLGAPLVGLLYHDSQVIPVLQILSISFFISAFSLVHQIGPSFTQINLAHWRYDGLHQANWSKYLYKNNHGPPTLSKYSCHKRIRQYHDTEHQRKTNHSYRFIYPQIGI